MAGETAAVRRSGRPPASLRWELDALATLATAGVRVPEVVPTDDGQASVAGIVVQRWIEGRQPTTTDDWLLVAEALRRVHRVPAAQRPGAMAVTELRRSGRSIDADLASVPDDVANTVLGVFASLADAPMSLIHGDPNPTNIRIDDEGEVWLLDWDESRVDLSWHDLSNLGVQVLPDDEHRRAQLLSHAWETVNAWIVEPDYARRRYRALEVGVAALGSE